MKKIVIHSPGGYEKLCLEEHPTIPMKPGHIKVGIQAAGINYADITIRWGLYESAKQYVGWPITPGFEYAGKVLESDSSKFKVGDEVFGISLFGGYASEIVVPEHQVYHRPKSLDVESAAGFPAVFMTAYHALFQNIVIRPGMKALIHSRSEEHTSELQSRENLVCRLLLEKKNN